MADRRADKYQPAVVAIGGGTGLSTMLRGLKKHTRDLTAIVTVADDGGGSGVLRKELGMLPPGDIRNCIRALANTEPTMDALLGYRFTEGSLAGQNFGNLFLAALNGMSDSFDQAVARMCEVLAVTGRVLPVTSEDIRLAAVFDDGSEIVGESLICDRKKELGGNITKVRLIPEKPAALDESIAAIERAEYIILGPGSLYTSIIPNLLTDGVPEAIIRSDALKIYVLNVMTQDGETEGYAGSDHFRALFAHGGYKLFDYCLANDLPAPEALRERYAAEGAGQTIVDKTEMERLGVQVFTAPVADWGSGYARRDPDALAWELMRIFRDRSRTRIYG